MASFPTAAKTFAARANGQVIDAAHVGDLQDEVAAIEDGLLNGTARLNSSNSTVANLSVLGNSTFVGTITFSTGATLNGLLTVSSGGITVSTGNVTFGQNLSVAGDLTVTKCPPTARVRNSADIAVANATLTGLNFDTQEFVSTSVMHNTGVNSSRLTVASSGVWMVGCNVRWNSPSTAGNRYVEIRQDDATVLVSAMQRCNAAVNDGEPQQCLTTVQNVATSTSFFTVRVLQDSGSTGSLDSNHAPNFWLTKIR